MLEICISFLFFYVKIIIGDEYMKKLNIIVILLMLIMVLVSCGSEETPYTYKEDKDHGKATITGVRYNDQAEMVIPTYINNLRVVGIAEQAFKNHDEITTLSVPPTVEIIDDFAFWACHNLKTIEFTGDSHLEEIGNAAFELCKSLVEVKIPASVKKLGMSAFAKCSSLTLVTFEDGINLEEISNGAFEETRIRTITIPNSVKVIRTGAFDACKSLTSIKLPDNLQEIEGFTFRDCEALTEITIPRNVSWIRDSTFKNCYRLAKVTFLEDTVLATISDEAFYNCLNLDNVVIPLSIRNISFYAFGDCTNLNNFSYLGTTEQWNNLNIAPSWCPYSKISTVHCSDGDVEITQ